MTIGNYLTGQESREDLLRLRRRRIREKRIKMAYAPTDDAIFLSQSEKERIQNLYLPPEYPRIA